MIVQQLYHNSSLDFLSLFRTRSARAVWRLHNDHILLLKIFPIWSVYNNGPICRLLRVTEIKRNEFCDENCVVTILCSVHFTIIENFQCDIETSRYQGPKNGSNPWLSALILWD